MTTNYARGRAHEYKTRDALYEQGAVLVVRAAGSHTPADLVALFPEEYHYRGVFTPVVHLVQCKRDGKIPKKELTALLILAGKTGARAWVSKQGERGNPVVLEELL